MLGDVVENGFRENVAPSTLPLDERLAQRLDRRAESYNDTLNEDYPPDSGFDSPEQEQAFP